MIRLLSKILFVVLIFSATVINAQKFGFGCLGLSGFYVGISEHHYKAPGINDYVNTSLVGSLIASNEKINFNLASGYRVGANFFRAKWDNIFITAKGFYQFLKEEHTANSASQAQQKFQMKMNNWGVGLDIGIPVNSFIDWKIVEGGVTFYSAELNQQNFADNSLSSEAKFSPEKSKPSYYAGTGVILHIIPDYMSLEGTATYYFMNIDEFQRNIADVGVIRITDPISKAGWGGTLQLNISFPF
ncbi:MAG: hypothetical protein HYZ10_02335 [Ignavibacteriales bacterium]|nr:hypothetical protein [Ignavibacteriales bacterium]